MTPTTCTCHPGTTCTSAASCATARELHFGAQPAAVSDEQLRAIDDAHDWQTTEGRMAAYRAILALRPQAVPMTPVQIGELAEDGVFLRTITEIVRAVEAHHGITAPAGGEG